MISRRELVHRSRVTLADVFSRSLALSRYLSSATATGTFDFGSSTSTIMT